MSNPNVKEIGTVKKEDTVREKHGAEIILGMRVATGPGWIARSSPATHSWCRRPSVSPFVWVPQGSEASQIGHTGSCAFA